MSTKLTTPIKRQTDIVIDDGGVDRKLEVILQLNPDTKKPEIVFHLSGCRDVDRLDVFDAYELAVNGAEEFAKLTKPVKFRSGLEYKNGSKTSPLAIVIYPDDTVTIRQNGSAASTNLGALWTRAQMTEAKIEMPRARRKA